MYHAACKVEFQPFKRLCSQLTFLNFLLFMKYKVDTRYTIVQQFLLLIHYSNSSLVIPPGTAYTCHKHLYSTSVCHHKCISIVGYSYARNTWIQTFDTWLLCTSHTNKIDTMSNTATYVWVRGSSSLVLRSSTYILAIGDNEARPQYLQ